MNNKYTNIININIVKKKTSVVNKNSCKNYLKNINNLINMNLLKDIHYHTDKNPHFQGARSNIVFFSTYREKHKIKCLKKIH